MIHSSGQNHGLRLGKLLLEVSGVSGSKGGWGWRGTQPHHMHAQCPLYCKPNRPPLAEWPNGGDKKKRKKKSGFYESTHYNIVYALCRLLNRIFSVITESSFSGLFVK